MDQAQQGSSENSPISVDGSVPETRIGVTTSSQDECESGEDGVSETRVNYALDFNKVVVEDKKVVAREEEKCSCVIDVKASGKDRTEKWNVEWVCRICHLNSEQSDTQTDIIQLGCSCKDELGIAHKHCAELWFKVKGNRSCEICGDTASNITGVVNTRFIEQWDESRFTDGSNNTARSRGCWRGQPFCNFLMACLVIAFVLPWFLHVNVF